VSDIAWIATTAYHQSLFKFLSGIEMAIQASNDTLMQQAPMTADEYLRAGVRTIDKQFGDGYAKQHPELLAAYMKTCAMDFGTSMLVVAIQEAVEQVAGNDVLARAVRDAAEEISGAMGG
jgi:hypothetical protein